MVWTGSRRGPTGLSAVAESEASRTWPYFQSGVSSLVRIVNMWLFCFRSSSHATACFFSSFSLHSNEAACLVLEGTRPPSVSSACNDSRFERTWAVCRRQTGNKGSAWCNAWDRRSQWCCKCDTLLLQSGSVSQLWTHFSSLSLHQLKSRGGGEVAWQEGTASVLVWNWRRVCTLNTHLWKHTLFQVNITRVKSPKGGIAGRSRPASSAQYVLIKRLASLTPLLSSTSFSLLTQSAPLSLQTDNRREQTEELWKGHSSKQRSVALPPPLSYPVTWRMTSPPLCNTPTAQQWRQVQMEKKLNRICCGGIPLLPPELWNLQRSQTEGNM